MTLPGACTRPVLLAGFMGSGKTTVGSILARRLSVPFRDLDGEIVRDRGPIADIFAKEGEPAFRAFEQKALRAILGYDGPMVVALGGGTLSAADNLALALQRGWLVYLRCRADTLARRTKGDTSRPLLAGVPELDRERTITRQLESRRCVYERAHLVVDADLASPPEVARRIEEWLPEVQR